MKREELELGRMYLNTVEIVSDVIKKMEKNYKSSDNLLIFHQALRSWMCEHVAMI